MFTMSLTRVFLELQPPTFEWRESTQRVVAASPDADSRSRRVTVDAALQGRFADGPASTFRSDTATSALVCQGHLLRSRSRACSCDGRVIAAQAHAYAQRLLRAHEVPILRRLPDCRDCDTSWTIAEPRISA